MTFESEPEDAYDAEDPIDVKLANIIRRLILAADDLVTIRTRHYLPEPRDDG